MSVAKIASTAGETTAEEVWGTDKLVDFLALRALRDLGNVSFLEDLEIFLEELIELLIFKNPKLSSNKLILK